MTWNHYCRITRQRLRRVLRNRNVSSDLVMPNSSFPTAMLEDFAVNGSAAQQRHHYWVPSRRADSVWRHHLQSRHIDMVKIDVDLPWRAVGVEGLLAHRAFSIMIIEVDGSWGGLLPDWNVSKADQFVWLARQHGFDCFLKVPCTTSDGGVSAWYFNVANQSHYMPRAISFESADVVQDLLVADSKRVDLRALESLGTASCDPHSLLQTAPQPVAEMYERTQRRRAAAAARASARASARRGKRSRWKSARGAIRG